MTYYIYKITNKINNKSYIGQSRKIRDRWVNHKRCANRVKHGATLKDNGIQIVHLALAKYGIENFIFEVIEEVDTQEQANDRETYWVSFFDSKNNGYNLTLGGNNAPKTEEWKEKVKATRIANGSYGHSEETKKLISEKWAQDHPYESIKKTADANRGRECSLETKKKISEANKGKQFCLGKKQSEETIKKRMDKINAKYGSKICNVPECDRTDGHKVDGVRYCGMHATRLQNTGSLDEKPRWAPTLGKPMSEETKKKVSEARKGKCTGKDNPFYGKKHNDEMIEYLRQINVGKEPPNKMKFTDEQIHNIIMDSRGLRKIAKDFGVSTPVIQRIKREYNKEAA